MLEAVPANNPPLELISKGTTDFNHYIPFVVIADANDDAYEESLARYYKVSTDIIEEYLWANAIGGTESSNFYQ